MADPDRKRPWTLLQRTYPLADRWLRLRHDVMQSPDGRTLPPNPVFEHSDWVDAIVLTTGLNIVLVQQYRHSVRSLRTEFPAGTMEAGEDPLVAMKRELLEETGYASDHWHVLGSALVYPSLQTNRIYSFLALNARKVADQTLDVGEAIEPFELPFSQFLDQVRSGALELPALQLAGLWLLSARLRGRGVPGTSIPFP